MTLPITCKLPVTIRILFKAHLKSLICRQRFLDRELLRASSTTRECLNYPRLCLGWSVRSHYLAYGYMRARPYRTIEQSCAPNNKPNVEAILKIVTEWWPWGRHTAETIEAWLLVT